ncbi:hypothetical protein D3C87_1882610 [compost metagenome]
MLLGPVERQPSGPSIEDMLNFGLDVGRTLDFGNGENRNRRSQPQMPETATEPRQDRRSAPVTSEPSITQDMPSLPAPPPPVPTYTHSKD